VKKSTLRDGQPQQQQQRATMLDTASAVPSHKHSHGRGPAIQQPSNLGQPVRA